MYSGAFRWVMYSIAQERKRGTTGTVRHFSSRKQRLAGVRLPVGRKWLTLRQSGGRLPESRCFVEERSRVDRARGTAAHRSGVVCLCGSCADPPRGPPIRWLPPFGVPSPVVTDSLQSGVLYYFISRVGLSRGPTLGMVPLVLDIADLVLLSR